MENKTETVIKIAEGQEIHTVHLAWATKKRHIAVDRNILCEATSKSAGYSVKNGSYNSIALSGLPTYQKHSDDVPGSHGDGIIEYKPIEQQKLRISTKTICKKCLSKYEKIMRAGGNFNNSAQT